MGNFCHLHLHTEYSLLDGAGKVKEVLDRAKELGQTAIAITEHGNMMSAVEANQYAKEIGIKHIVGCELYTSPWGRSMDDTNYSKGEKSNGHLIVLAKNKVGYKNLCRLCSEAYINGYYYKPRIDHALLEKYKEGLIVTSACMASSVNRSIFNGDIDKAREELRWFKDQFGDDFYVELQNHYIDDEKLVMDIIRDLAKELDIKTTVGIDAHYVLKDDEDIHDALLCIGTGQKKDAKDRRFKFNGNGYWVMSEQEVRELFPNDQDAVSRTQEIADKCDGDVIEYGDLKVPTFNVQEALDDNNSEGEFQEYLLEGEWKEWLNLA